MKPCPALEYHHTGYACNDLDTEARELERLGYVPEGEDFVDPHQRVRGRFLSGGGPRLELLVAEGDCAVLDPWLRGGTKMYHLGYETPDLEAAIDAIMVGRARLVSSPAPAPAFNGRRVAFLMLPTLLLIELIER